MEYNYIWLPKDRYPDRQEIYFGMDAPNEEKNKYKYTVAAFRKKYIFEKPLKSLNLNVGADVTFCLWINGKCIGNGPVSAGGDFLASAPLDWTYYNSYELDVDGETELDFYVLVRMRPHSYPEFSQGRGMFLLYAEGSDSEGKKVSFTTDETWLCRLDSRYFAKCCFDGTIPCDSWTNAERVSYPVTPEKSSLPPLEYVKIYPLGEKKTILKKGEKAVFDFDRIYSAHVCITVSNACKISLNTYETEDNDGGFPLTFAEKTSFRTISFYSVGGVRITLEDDFGNNETEIELSLDYSRFPVSYCGKTVTSDEGLNRAFDVCRHTLEICRQTIHLDSPSHQELLACTGDYYIEMMMTLFTYGDFRLAREDIIRTARWLRQNDGRMFHTSYSLIWVQMMKQYYMFTADKDTVLQCFESLKILLGRFETYIGEKGVIENPPDYMFVDWVSLEGYSMHHPPKALGGAVLNAFYYKALTDAVSLGEMVFASDAENSEYTEKWKKEADSLKSAFNRCFYDEEKKMYTDGLTDKEKNVSFWLPENIKEKHFSRYPQALASLYDLCRPEDKARLAEIAADESTSMHLVQPYFMHFVLEAVCDAGLENKYAMKILRKWIPLADDCPKGLQEGWILPEEGYGFDHSHAWGGTFAYHLPKILTGLKITEPGMKKYTISPNSLGLDSFTVTFNTPEGEVTVKG